MLIFDSLKVAIFATFSFHCTVFGTIVILMDNIFKSLNEKVNMKKNRKNE